MKNSKFISITLSIALASALGLSGCGSSNAPSSNIEKLDSKTDNINKGTNVLSGKIVLDETPIAQRSLRSLSSRVYSISAYNLDTKSVYKTTTDARGLYTLSGLSDGEYQVIAENDQVSKSAVQRVTLSKGVRKVVDFTLQAAGSIKGHIDGARVVFIPGKDHVSYADKNGNFEITNIPVGTYKLGYISDNGKGVVDITVKTGLSDLGNINAFSNIIEVDTNLPLGVLQLHYEGLKFHINSDSKLAYKLLENTKLFDSNGDEVEIDVRDYEGFSSKADSVEVRDNTKLYYEGSSYGRIYTKEIVPAGEYVLKISASSSDILDEDIEYKFSVDEFGVIATNYDYENSSRIMDVYLPKSVASDKQALFSDLKVREKGSSSSLNVKVVWTNDTQFTIFGGFKSGVEYEVELTNEQKAIVGGLRSEKEELKFKSAQISRIYPSDRDDISTDQKLSVYIDNMAELDPSTVQITVNNGTTSTTYSKNEIIFDGQNGYYYAGYGSSLSVANLKLEYAKDYSVKVEAKDIYGNKLEKESVFSTLSPKIIELEPEDMSDIFDDSQRIEFNVNIQKDSGKITIEDLTEDSSVEEIKKIDDYYVYSSVRFKLEEILPNHKYKITASGFKTHDGVEITSKSTEFTAPPRMMFIDSQYRQNINVNPDNFKHKVKLSFFGKLSDSEKKFIENHLIVTSYNQAIKSDSTHPVRKLFFNDTKGGTDLIVAFTIDKNTNYELAFNDISGLSDIVLPRGAEVNRAFLSFSTLRTGSDSSDSNGMSIIESMNFNINNSTMSNQSLNISFNIPGHTEYDNKSYREVCKTEAGILSNEDALNLLKESFNLTDQNDTVETKINNFYVHNSGSYYSKEYTSVCRYEANMNFETDYDKKYTATLDFRETFPYSVPTKSKLLIKEFKTDPIGKLNFWVEDNKNSDAIKLHITPNAPIVNSNLSDILHLSVEGIDTNITMNVDSHLDMDGIEAPGDSGDKEIKRVDSIEFLIPRTAYSVSKFTLSKAEGENLRFYNNKTKQVEENAQILSEPIVFVESVSPDLVPLKVDELQTTSTENNALNISFNRAINLADLVKFRKNTLEIEDIAFKVEDESGKDIPISYIAKKDESKFELGLSSPLDVTKEYKLSLKEGKSIQVAFGVQKLESFEHVIKPTVIGADSAYIIKRNSHINTSKSDPFLLGSSEKRNREYLSESESEFIVDIKTVDGVEVDIDKSKVEVKRYGNSIAIGDLKLDGDKLIQNIKSYYSIDEAYVKLFYTYSGLTDKFESIINNIEEANIASIASIAGNGLNTINFSFQSDQDYKITKDNFKVYDLDENLIEAQLDVQFKDEYSLTYPNVTFNSLDADTIYRIDILGIPSYRGKINPDIIVDSVFIKTAPNANEDNDENSKDDTNVTK